MFDQFCGFGLAFESFFRMSMENSLAIKFTGKNYATWEFQFRIFLKGKKLWSDIDGFSTAPENEKELTKWVANDARIISWILASFEAHMVNNLRSFNTAKDMWDYLKRIYHQDNTVKRFQLQLEISSYSQGNLSIEDICASNNSTSLLLYQRSINYCFLFFFFLQPRYL